MIDSSVSNLAGELHSALGFDNRTMNRMLKVGQEVVIIFYITDDNDKRKNMKAMLAWI